MLVGRGVFTRAALLLALLLFEVAVSLLLSSEFFPGNFILGSGVVAAVFSGPLAVAGAVAQLEGVVDAFLVGVVLDLVVAAEIRVASVVCVVRVVVLIVVMVALVVVKVVLVAEMVVTVVVMVVQACCCSVSV